MIIAVSGDGSASTLSSKPGWTPRIWKTLDTTLMRLNEGVFCTVVIIPRLHDTTGCQTGCTTGCHPVIQPVCQPVGCLFKRCTMFVYTLFNRLSNRFHNRLYCVYKHSTGCVWQQLVSCKRGFSEHNDTCVNGFVCRQLSHVVWTTYSLH